MAVLRIPTYLLWVLIAAIVILVVVFAFVKLHSSQTTATAALPMGIRYALEYFNAVKSNATLLVPSQYYAAAKDFSVNGNKAVENSSLYYSVLFNDTSLPKGYYILLDMENVTALPDIIAFPYNFTLSNISSSLRDCDIARSDTEALSVCDVYSNVSLNISNVTVNRDIRVGSVTFATFPGNSTLTEINSTIVYNGQNRTNIPSVRLNDTAFMNGSIFIYVNNAAFYLSSQALGTFYGREMFLPNSTLKNVFDNFFTTRIVS